MYRLLDLQVHFYGPSPSSLPLEAAVCHRPSLLPHPSPPLPFIFPMIGPPSPPSSSAILLVLHHHGSPPCSGYHQPSPPILSHHHLCHQCRRYYTLPIINSSRFDVIASVHHYGCIPHHRRPNLSCHYRHPSPTVLFVALPSSPSSHYAATFVSWFVAIWRIAAIQGSIQWLQSTPIERGKLCEIKGCTASWRLNLMANIHPNPFEPNDAWFMLDLWRFVAIRWPSLSSTDLNAEWRIFDDMIWCLEKF